MSQEYTVVVNGSCIGNASSIGDGLVKAQKWIAGDRSYNGNNNKVIIRDSRGSVITQTRM